MGFCGGMCWRALQRFYNAIPIPRDEPPPSEGDDLYNELWDTQVNSVPVSLIGKLLNWQSSPKTTIPGYSYVRESLGSRTQNEWPQVKNSIDSSKPVTITLIAHSNEVLPTKLVDHHRVVAYAYDIRPVSSGDDAPSGADSKVTLRIYDPNEPNDNNVRLTFFLGADGDDIKLRHTYKGSRYKGFFKDDKNRKYRYSVPTYVRIDNCEQTGFSSATLADYQLTFSWQCSFIPYFNIIIDDVNWQYNTIAGLAKSQFQPIGEDNKQCPSWNSNLNIGLKLPRNISKVEVRLLDNSTYNDSIEVDAVPGITCYPFINSRAVSDQLCIFDNRISDIDLFIKESNPSESEVEQLDLPFRWVLEVRRGHVDTRRPRDDLTTATLETFQSTRLGNVIVPILANFEEKNLAPPTVKSGIVKRNGTVIQTINPMDDQNQEIFDGFTNNPSDYDNNTEIEFLYKSRDRTGVEVTGKAWFYGQSIIFRQFSIFINVFDPNKLARLQGMAIELVKRGLLDVVIGLQPRSIDPVQLMNKIRSHSQLQGLIDQAIRTSWSNSSCWQVAWKVQSAFLKLTETGRANEIMDMPVSKKGDMFRATKELQERQQGEVDTLALNVVVNETIRELTQDPTAVRVLMSL